MPARAGRNLATRILSPAVSRSTQAANDNAVGASSVIRVAHLLGVSEFQVFQLARARHTGRMAEDREIEPDFVQYLKHGRVAAWVATYVARVMAAAERPDFDAQRLGGLHQPVDAAEARRFEVWNLAILAFAIVGCWLITHI